MEKIENRPKFVVETERIYSLFEPEINILRQCPVFKKTDIVLREIIISAYVKAYDFVRYICTLSNYQDAFFQLPMLRGICEDLITISYLINQSDNEQNYLIVVKQFEELKKSTKAQVNFFSKYNSGQIVPPLANQSDIHPMLEEHRRAGNTFEVAKLPTIFEMAKKVGLEDLYLFIYHSTSKMVHFDIYSLLCMGWGNMDKELGTIEPNFSYRHDYKHYYTFALFYSSYLFIQQTKKFDEFLNLPQTIMSNLEQLEESYQKIDWPLLVTFNQMNIKPPNFFFKAVYREIQNQSK